MEIQRVQALGCDEEMVYRYIKIISELTFAIFCYAGAFKGTSLVEETIGDVDLTFLSFLLTAGMVALRFTFEQKIQIPSKLRVFLLLLVGFVLLCTISCLFTSTSNDEALKKLAQVLVFGLGGAVFGVVILQEQLAQERFLLITFAIATIVGIDLVLSKQMQFIVGALGADDNYQWLSKIALFGIFSGLYSFLRARSLQIRLVILICLCILVFAAVVGGARQAIFGMVLSLVFLVYAKKATLSLKPRTFFAGISILAALWVVINYFADAELRGVQRVSASLEYAIEGNFQDLYAASKRYIPQRDGLIIYSNHPVWGIGFGNFRQYASTDEFRHPHNYFIEALSEMGVFGLIFAILPFFYLIWHLLHRGKLGHSNLTMAWGTMLVAQIFSMMVSGDFGTNRIFYILGACFFMSLQTSSLRKTSERPREYPAI